MLGTYTHNWVYGDPQGEPVVFVHGFRGDHHGLEGLALAMSAANPGLAIHVPDLPGFGTSPAIPGRTHDIALYGEWLRAFVREVMPNGGSIMGHSFGSLVVSSALAAGTPSRRTVLINPISAPALEGPKAALTKLAVFYYRAADALPERASRQLLANPLIVRVMSEVMAKTRDRKLRSWIHNQHAQYFSVFSDTSTLLDAFRASVSHTVGEFAEAFTMPTLLVAGDRDDITPLEKQLDLERTLPNAELKIVLGSGHLVHYEAVHETIEYMTEFWAKTASPAADREAAQTTAASADENPAAPLLDTKQVPNA